MTKNKTSDLKEEIMKKFTHICGTPEKCECDYQYVEIAVSEAIRITREECKDDYISKRKLVQENKRMNL